MFRKPIASPIAWIAAFATAALLITPRAYADEDDEPPAPPPPPAVVTPPAPPPPVIVQPPAAAPAPVIVNPHPSPYQGEGGWGVGPGLVVGGLSLFGVTYAGAAIASAVWTNDCNGRGNADTSTLGCRTNDWVLYIPVAGPFIQMGYVEGQNAGTAKALLAVDGAFQSIGAAMFVTGLIISAVPHPPVYTRKGVHLTPYATGTAAGVSAFGNF